jgi:hypothetical protein
MFTLTYYIIKTIVIYNNIFFVLISKRNFIKDESAYEDTGSIQKDAKTEK